MPYQNGQYIPEDAIGQEYKFADNLQNQKWSPTLAGVLAAGIGGLGAGIHRNSAQNALTGNQAMMSQALKGVGSATTPEQAQSVLLSSGVPSLEQTGAEQKLKTLSADPNREYRLRDAQWKQLGNTPESPGYKQWVLTGKLPEDPKYQVIGEDDFGAKKYGYPPAPPGSSAVVSATGGSGGGGQAGAAPVVGGAPTAADAPTPVAELQGDEFLKSLEQKYGRGIPDTVRAMVEGRIAPPGAMALRSPKWQKILEFAGQYEPGFDLTAWGGRAAGNKDFYGGGKSSEMVRSANQTIGHLGDLVESMKTLDNGQIPALNYVKNEFGKATGKPGLDPFVTNAHAVAGELSKVFKGANISDTEIAEWEKTLSPNMSPDQQKAAVVKLSHLLNSALDALEQKRTQSLGENLSKKKGPLLDQHSQETLRKIKEWAGDTEATPGMTEDVAPPAAAAAPSPAAPTAAQPAPVQIQSDADYEALPAGATYIGPDGKTRTKR